MLLRNILFALVCFFLFPTLSSGALPDNEQGALLLRQALVRDIQNYELLFGFIPTRNFKTYDETTSAIYFCYYTEKLDLTMHFVGGTKDGCAVDESRYDVRFYPAQAAAGMGIPLMASLVQASLDRFVVVVFHEDFHEQVSGIPTLALNESSATLMGLLLAREFTHKIYGAQSAAAKNIVSDIDAFLRSSLIEGRYVVLLHDLYARVAYGEITRDEGLRLKKDLFDQIKNECFEIKTKLIFSCSELRNNADLSYHLNYTTHYPLFFQLYNICRQDVGASVGIIISLVRERLSEEQFILRVQEIINKKCT